jgi:predicted MFS family arabinose efflux permease
MSLFLLGGPLSMATGYLLGGWITQWAGWRSAFLAVAALGVFLTALVALTVREPRSLRTEVDITRRPKAESVPLVTLMSTLWKQPTFRNLLLAFLVEALCGNGLLQWIPVFFLRVHRMGTGELGTWLAVNWGLGNALGTFAGGYLTGRSTQNAERFQLKVMTLVALVYVPLNLSVLLIPTPPVALGLLFVGAFVNALASAPGYSLIQSLVPENMRATAVAAIFLVSNLIGLGFGPVIVGWLSDQLAADYGADALRYALLCCAPGYLLVAAYYKRASRTVMSDIAAVEARQS